MSRCKNHITPAFLGFFFLQDLFYYLITDIFKNKIANKILRRCYMLPIFRQRDGVNTIEKNEETFIACYKMLNNRENLMIFPEGNHNYKKI